MNKQTLKTFQQQKMKKKFSYKIFFAYLNIKRKLSKKETLFFYSKFVSYSIKHSKKESAQGFAQKVRFGSVNIRNR